MTKLWLIALTVVCGSPCAVLAHPSASLQKAAKIPFGIYIHDDTVITGRVEYRLPPAVQIGRKVVVFRQRLSVFQKGLTLFVHNRHFSVNGKRYHKLKSGDHVVVGTDESVRINGIKQ